MSMVDCVVLGVVHCVVDYVKVRLMTSRAYAWVCKCVGVHMRWGAILIINY